MYMSEKRKGRGKCIISLSGNKTTYTLFLLRNMAEIQLELVNLKGEQVLSTSTIRRLDFCIPRYLDLPSGKVLYVDRLKVSFGAGSWHQNITRGWERGFLVI